MSLIRQSALLTAVCGVLSAATAPTFSKDVAPILQQNCQTCHRPGEPTPFSLLSYKEARPWAASIKEAVVGHKMPPWYADPHYGKFANDRTLTQAEIDTLAGWADAGALQGDAKDAPPPRVWPAQGNLASPDAVLAMPRAFAVPAKGAVEYQRFVIHTGFDGDRWVQAVEVRPGARAVVHHVVVYIRDPGETWVEGATKSDMLTVYAPGSAPEVWPEGMAKLIPKGADLVMELHYTPNGKAVSDQTRVAIKFAASAPHKRVLTLQMQPARLVIPPGEANAHFTVSGTLPNDALLLGFFPHMHLRGTAFEYDRIITEEGRADGRPDVMLRVSHYDFHWQMDYRLAQPIALPQGTRLSWTAWYDNSANNPSNPDPTAEVRWGEQSWEEMMVGFFYVAVDPAIDRQSFFVRE